MGINISWVQPDVGEACTLLGVLGIHVQHINFRL